MTYVTVQEFVASLVLRNIVSDIYCPFYGGDDLIDQSSNSWKKELIKRISHFSSAKKILSNSNDLHNCARIYHFSSAKEYSL